MKSSINSLVDYRETPLEKNITVRCPKDHIQTQMKHLTRGYKKTEEVQTVEKGDVVILSLESELPKFNRPMVPVTVEGNLFDAELEKQLSGHSVGENFTVMVQGKTVTVTVKQASRTTFPEPTDEMAAAYAAEHEDFAGISTVEEYRSRVIEKYLAEQRQDAIFKGMDEVLDYVLTHSDWNFDEDEVNERMEESLNEIREQLKDEGKELESLTEEELNMNFGVSTMEQFNKMLRDSTECSIASDLWVLAIHGKNSFEEIEGYPWAFMQEFVTENLNITEER